MSVFVRINVINFVIVYNIGARKELVSNESCLFQSFLEA